MKRISMMDIYGFFQTSFRKRRLNLFRDVIRPTSLVRILDVGGNPQFWDDLKVSVKITILNPDMLSEDLVKKYSQFDFIDADGCNMPYSDKSFDIGFSNSAIEHVGTYERQKAFAAELRRGGSNAQVAPPVSIVRMARSFRRSGAFGAFFHVESFHFNDLGPQSQGKALFDGLRKISWHFLKRSVRRRKETRRAGKIRWIEIQ